MFSGIVEELGKVTSASDDSGGRRLKIHAPVVASDLKLGDSIAVNGICLTACEFGNDWFAVEATFETLKRTSLGSVAVNDTVNLERALRLSDRLGGHLVSGHVDCVGKLVSIKEEGFSKVMEFAVDTALRPFFVEKGSVTVDGVSLTVAGLVSAQNGGPGKTFAFSVALIPHTLSVTTLGQLQVGDAVNIEADVIGKYVANMVKEGYLQNIGTRSSVTLELLQENGYA